MPPSLAKEIEAFEQEIALKKAGKLDDKVFAETRLRRGAYGQRYDNGHRHDGKQSRTLPFPSDGLTKGPHTLWDAPGMQRIKIPFGGVNAAQLETMADVAEEYSVGVAHVTTRQDFQLHYIHIEDTPALMRRLAAVGITTREACGNTVRNVTACPLAGVCHDEVFDVTPYAQALAGFLLGHPDCQNFGRKFKIAFSGCSDKPCALVRIHDLGAVAATREVDGETRRGFALYVGGGLGTVPYQAKLMEEFLPEEELLPTAQAIARVFTRLGEKRNRNAARLKFLVAKLGIDEFRRLVAEERKTLAEDPAWTAYIPGAHAHTEQPVRPPGLVQIGAESSEEYRRWLQSNVHRQRQSGYAAVTLTLPLGDITSDQLRAVARICRTYVRETARTTVEQNIVLRWVSESGLPQLHDELSALGLAEPCAGSIVDITACPGTDTCKLGIASSRGLAAELRSRLAERNGATDAIVRGLRVKISGCFNSCGQHHIADVGFYGVSRNRQGYTVPHFQVLLGGQWSNNAGSYGLAIGAVPSKRVPEVLDRITNYYLEKRTSGEDFHSFVRRIGKGEFKTLIEDLSEVLPYAAAPELFTDWGDPREFTLGDLGVGECAGEVVSPVEFQLAACEREAFEAQLHLEQSDPVRAAQTAYASMLHAAQALLEFKLGSSPEDADESVHAFRRHYYDTQVFFDPFAQGKFADYFFAAHAQRDDSPDHEQARRLVEECQLFLEAAHSCHARLLVNRT